MKTRNHWKTVLAVLAAGAVMTGVLGASQAMAAVFTSESSPTKFSGSPTSTPVLTTDTGKVECTWAIFTGEREGKALEHFSLTPSYSGCKAFGFTATIKLNGCKYKLYAAETADLVCPASKDVEIVTQSNSCNVTIQPQTGLSSVTFTNGTSGEKADITANFNITNIKYTETGGSCAASGKATTSGKLEGSVTLWGADADNNPTGVSFDAEPPPPPNFTSEALETKLSGTNVGTASLSMDSGKVECTTSTFASEAEDKFLPSIVVAPVYSGCSAFGWGSATITMNGCTYRINAAKTADLVCPAGKDVVIDVVFNPCSVTIQPQTGLSSITFTNGSSGGKADITADFNIGNIKYEESGFACAASGKATTGGGMSGSYTISGKDPAGNPVGFSWDS